MPACSLISLVRVGTNISWWPPFDILEAYAVKMHCNFVLAVTAIPDWDNLAELKARLACMLTLATMFT